MTKQVVLSILWFFLVITSLAAQGVRGATPFIRETAATGSFSYASMALDSKGNPHVAFWDLLNQFLVVARRENNVWITEVAVANGFVGADIALAIDAQDKPHVVFNSFDLGVEGAFYAFKSAGVWQPYETIVSGGGFGRFCSLALDSQGIPHVSYVNQGTWDLEYAVRSAGWVTETAFANFTYLKTSITIDALERPHIAHIDDSGGLQYYSARINGLWQTNIFDTDPTALPNFYCSIDMTPSDKPAIAYFVQGPKLKFAIYDGSTWTIETVDGGAGNWCALQMASDGVAHISAYEASAGALKYYKRTAPATWVTEFVDFDGNTGTYTSLALDAHGNPSISYIDAVSGDLRHADSSVRLADDPTGTTWPVGAERSVSWHGTGTVSIQLSTDGGASYKTLASSLTGGTTGGLHMLTVPHTPSRFCKLQVIRNSPYSVAKTDSLFTIETSVSLLSLLVVPAKGVGNYVAWQTSPGPPDLAGYRLARGREGTVRTTIVPLTSATSFTDVEGKPSDRYHLYAVNGLGEELYLGEGASQVPSFSNLHAWPNPFSSGLLTVQFASASAPGGGKGHTRIAIYDVSGRLVHLLADNLFSPQMHILQWDGRNRAGRLVPGGVYFLQSATGGTIETRKINVVR